MGERYAATANFSPLIPLPPPPHQRSLFSLEGKNRKGQNTTLDDRGKIGEKKTEFDTKDSPRPITPLNECRCNLNTPKKRSRKKEDSSLIYILPFLSRRERKTRLGWSPSSSFSFFALRWAPKDERLMKRRPVTYPFFSSWFRYVGTEVEKRPFSSTVSFSLSAVLRIVV